MKYTVVLLPFFALAACQTSYEPGQTVTLSDGEVCTVVGPDAQGTQLNCPTRGIIVADIQTPNINEQVAPINAALNPEIIPGTGILLSDVPGAPRVPRIPTVPQSEAHAACLAGQYAQNRVRGAAEGALLGAVGLPGNTLGVIRRSQQIARRIEGRPAPVGSANPCTAL